MLWIEILPACQTNLQNYYFCYRNCQCNRKVIGKRLKSAQFRFFPIFRCEFIYIFPLSRISFLISNLFHDDSMVKCYGLKYIRHARQTYKITISAIRIANAIGKSSENVGNPLNSDAFRFPDVNLYIFFLSAE